MMILVILMVAYENNDICGIANVLQFSIGKHDNQIWFSDWSQNKIGILEL